MNHLPPHQPFSEWKAAEEEDQSEEGQGWCPEMGKPCIHNCEMECFMADTTESAKALESEEQPGADDEDIRLRIIEQEEAAEAEAFEHEQRYEDEMRDQDEMERRRQEEIEAEGSYNWLLD